MGSQERVLVIDRKTLKEKILSPFWGASEIASTKREAIFIPFAGLNDFFRFMISVSPATEVLPNRKGRFMLRSSSLEHNQDFQQIISYGVVIKPGDKTLKVLVYRRNAAKGAYKEERLGGKHSVGVGGHVQVTDRTLRQSLIRELIEETKIFRDGNMIDSSKLCSDFGRYKEYFKLVPCGLIKDETNSVGKVHLGAVFLIIPHDNVDIRMRTGKGEESISYKYMTFSEYQKGVNSGSINPESWTTIFFEKALPFVKASCCKKRE